MQESEVATVQKYEDRNLRRFDEMIFSCLADIHFEDDDYMNFSGDSNEYLNALQDLLDLAGCSIYCMNMNDRGSFFSELKAIFSNRVTRDSIEEKLDILEGAMTSVVLLKGEVPLEEHEAKIASTYLSKVTKKKKAVVLIGALLVLKLENDDDTSTIVTRRLDKNELDLLFRYPASLRDPMEALDVLALGHKRVEEDLAWPSLPRVKTEPFLMFLPDVPSFGVHPFGEAQPQEDVDLKEDEESQPN